MAFLFLVLLPSCVCAQSFSYGQHHDEVLKNQFSVQTYGMGNLGDGDPLGSEYYWLTHNSYAEDAASKNTATLRALLKPSLFNEEFYSVDLDSALSERRRVELLNVLDRDPATDATWQVERSRIERGKDTYLNNINQICMNGGTTESQRQWMEKYRCIECALNVVRNSYLPQGKRKEQYLAIYRDIVSQNAELCEYLLFLRGTRKPLESVTITPGSTYQARSALRAREAHSKWRHGWSLGVVTTSTGD